MNLGFWIVKGDKTTCGGSVLEGHSRGQKFGPNLNPQAVQGSKVSCGKHPGIYSIRGGHPGEIIHGSLAASTLYSRSTCPCGALFIPTHTWAKHGPCQDSPIRGEPSKAKSVTELIQHIHTDKTPNNFAYTCQPEDNELLNGVFIWTETKNAGHAFVSVHENNDVFLYTYGRYGRTGPGSFTGDGILNFLRGEDARVYYRSELYVMEARVFRITDANPQMVRKYFEDLWNNGKPAIQTLKMPETTRRRGHTIDEYDVTGNNCTTHSVEGIKFSGSKLFENEYQFMTTLIPVQAEEDFTVPVSLQRYLTEKAHDLTSVMVVEMTDAFKSIYPDNENRFPFQESSRGKAQNIAAESAAMGDSLSPYSGGTVGDILGGSYDIQE